MISIPVYAEFDQLRQFIGKKMFWKPYSAMQMQNIIGSEDHMFGPIFGIYAVSPLKICKLRTLSLMHLDLILVTVLRK